MESVANTRSPSTIKRLNYIGSKYQLLEWLQENIECQIETSFQGLRIADLFAGTGVVSLHFSNLGATVTSNDVEAYSSTIAKALLKSSFNKTCQEIVEEINESFLESNEGLAGFITQNYSPYEDCRRQFFTVENAKRIDYVREFLFKSLRQERITEDDYSFLMASLLVSADSIANVPAVYGSFLKAFKQKAKNSFVLRPLYDEKTDEKTKEPKNHVVYSLPVVQVAQQMEPVDVVYLDPPYNERQYSTNYFPLNMIAKTPEETNSFLPLKGVTGIPHDCYRSDFCKKTKVKEAFRELFTALHKKTKWIFLSYNSESLLSKAIMLEIIEKTCPRSKTEVIERDYKRFKNFDYGKDSNETGEVIEYLFCVRCQLN